MSSHAQRPRPRLSVTGHIASDILGLYHDVA